MWKRIEGYPDYSISDDGKIRSAKTGIEMNPHLTNGGYLRIKLQPGKMFFIHRLIANAFLPKVEGKEQVNHINGVKTDNRVENLEWCTMRENQLHSRQILRKKPGFKTRAVICCETGKYYESSYGAAKALGIDSSSIVKCARGKRSTAGGFHWKYAD